MADILHGAGYTLLALILLMWVGNLACRALFSVTGLKPPSAPEAGATPPAGWLIGALERLLLSAGIAAESWEVVAAVIALKSVARFRELNEKEFAEYFLVGSLFSVLWALLVTTLWLAYDSRYGVDLRGYLSAVSAP
ncbi:MAG: hypothetical protein AAF871_12575 [Pseudomonadota bacterium]